MRQRDRTTVSDAGGPPPSARAPDHRPAARPPLDHVDGGIAPDGVPSRSRWTVNVVAATPVTRSAPSRQVAGCQSNVPGRHDKQFQPTPRLAGSHRNPAADRPAGHSTRDDVTDRDESVRGEYDEPTATYVRVDLCCAESQQFAVVVVQRRCRRVRIRSSYSL